MNWEHSIEAARLLAGADRPEPTAPGRPRQAMLRRAVNGTYYAMFNSLCKSNADTLVGTSPNEEDEGLWLDTYRALQHNVAKNRLAQYARRHDEHPALTAIFSQSIQQICRMQRIKGRL